MSELNQLRSIFPIPQGVHSYLAKLGELRGFGHPPQTSRCVLLLPCHCLQKCRPPLVSSRGNGVGAVFTCQRLHIRAIVTPNSHRPTPSSAFTLSIPRVKLGEQMDKDNVAAEAVQPL